jgi:hypothetical protein
MNSLIRPLFAAAVLTGSLAAGCSEEVVEPKPEFPANPGPITLSAETRGVPVELVRATVANAARYGAVEDAATAAFLYAEIYSEYVQATDGAGGRTDLPDRVDDIYDELGDEIAAFEDHYVIVDLQRRDRAWLVDWEGRERDEPENREGSMTFGDTRRQADYWVDVEERLLEVVGDHDLEGVIIGAEMNRYYDQAQPDYDSFVDFYWTMYDAIKAAAPDVRVSAGLNWSYFVESQVGQFTEGDETASDVAPFRRAWDAIVDPVLTRYDADGNPTDRSDFAAFAAIPNPDLYGGQPSNVPESHFAGLRDAIPTGSGTPVVWFQLGWPVAGAGASSPAQWYEFFLENAGGHEIESVSWWGLTDLFTDGDCNPLTSEGVGAPESICFRGLYSVSGAPTSLANSFFE